jgi:diguanylate cyclase (GGDEF)-like protein/PAS domain S-box-containing protein
MAAHSEVQSASPGGPLPSDERARAARATIDALTASSDVFETFFEAARIGLALADLTGRYVRVNDTYASMLGRRPEDLIGIPISDVLGGGDPGALQDLLSGRVASVQAERQYVHVDGTTTWLLHGVATVMSPEGGPAWFAVSAQDISERRRAEQDLRDLTAALTERAVRDPLTGLANRALLEERLRGSLARDARSGEATGVLFLDLDGFKEVNDRHGHAVGDAVLRAVADRLCAAVRPSDTAARLGGDEFVVLVEGASEAALETLVPRLVAAVTAPLTVHGAQVGVGVSVGVALSRAGADDPQGLLSRADERMYAAKRAASR